MKTLITLITLAMLTGCGFTNTRTPEPVEVVTIQIPLEIYQPPNINPLQMENVRWYVMTEENIESKMAEIRQRLGGDFVVFAMTPQSYENLSVNIQDIERYIAQQIKIIEYYQQATQPEIKKTTIPVE
jgi:hypothetical protein